jgi:hypothetical protein
MNSGSSSAVIAAWCPFATGLSAPRRLGTGSIFALPEAIAKRKIWPLIGGVEQPLKTRMDTGFEILGEPKWLH